MNITQSQVDKIIVDAGVVYINYGLPSQRLLAPCRGGNTVEFENELRDIEANGFKGKTKGMRRTIVSNAKMQVNFMDLSLENLKMALPGSKLSANKLKNGWDIELSDYIDNVTLIAKQNNGTTYRKITLFNVLVDEPISIETAKDEEAVLAVTFAAHYDLGDPEEKLWEMEDITVVASQSK